MYCCVDWWWGCCDCYVGRLDCDCVVIGVGDFEVCEFWYDDCESVGVGSGCDLCKCWLDCVFYDFWWIG